MSAFQVCARCATRWPVGARPAIWCPRCHGVLLSPVSAQAPAQGRRNFTWVARKPKSKESGRRREPVPARTATPRYDETPQWGLIDRPVTRQDERESRVERWAGAAPGLLVLAAALLALSVAAELFRYGILLYNRTRLVDPTTLVISDALVLFAEVASVVIGVAASIGAACWLVTRRRAAFVDAGLSDPRRGRTVMIGCLVPGLSLVMPGVFLTELVNVRARVDRDRILRIVRIWWGAWVIDWLLVLGVSLWRLRDSLQAQADGVLLSALVALFGVALAAQTLYVIRSVDGLRLTGATRAAPTRWVVSAARPEPVPATTADPETADVETAEPEVQEKVTAS